MPGDWYNIHHCFSELENWFWFSTIQFKYFCRSNKNITAMPNCYRSFWTLLISILLCCRLILVYRLVLIYRNSWVPLMYMSTHTHTHTSTLVSLDETLWIFLLFLLLLLSLCSVPDSKASPCVLLGFWVRVQQINAGIFFPMTSTSQL